MSGTDSVIVAFKLKEDAVAYVERNYPNNTRIYIHETILK